MTMTDINPEKLAARTIGLALKSSRFGSEREGDITAISTDASKSLLGLKKHLVPKTRGANRTDAPEAAVKAAEALRAVTLHDLNTQRWVRRIGLPSYFQDGTHRIPLGLLDRVQHYLTGRADERVPLVNAFVDAYPALIDAMQGPLGSQYKRSDFPRPDEVSEGFEFSWRWFELDGVPTRVQDVSEDAYAQAQKEIKKTMRKVAEGVRLAMRGYLLEIVKEVRGKLTGEADGTAKKFRQSTLLQNLTEFFETFPLRNVTDDDDLRKVVADLTAMTNSIDLETVKTDAGLQANLAATLDGTIKTLDALMVERGARVITFDDESL